MSSLFTPGQGFFVRTPSWHRLERAVLEDWPGTWKEAAEQSGLGTWDPLALPAYVVDEGESSESFRWSVVGLDEGWQRIVRSDTGKTLSYQEDSYRVIKNSEFGDVIEAVMGFDLEDDRLKFEAAFELDGGRMVVAVLHLEQALHIEADPSPTYRYACFVTRHDGQGGLRCILTNVRVVCANTLGMAENGSTEGVTGFTIRHTANWDERVAEVRQQMLGQRAGVLVYEDVMAQLAKCTTSPRTRETYLKRLLPIGDDMGLRQQNNRLAERETIRTILEGPTCEHISGTAYGLLQASTEWSDHYRRDPGSVQSYVKRQLTTSHDMKGRALALTKKMAGV